MMKGIVDKQIEKIEELASIKQREIDAANYEKYVHLFDIAAKYFKNKPVLMYGGTALNELFPDSLKFYDPKTLPDIDVFVLDANIEQLAQGLVNEYLQQGFAHAAYKPALHENTLKVYAEGVQIADISGVSTSTFKVLKKNSVKSGMGIRVVNPQFLRLSLHMQLSQPYDARRWRKVFERLDHFYKVFPPPKCDIAKVTRVQDSSMKPSDEAMEKVHLLLADFFKKSPYVMFGFDAVRMFLGKGKAGADSTLVPKWDAPSFMVLSEEEPRTTAYNIINALRSSADSEHVAPSAFKISKEFAEDGFVPKHVLVYFKRKVICSIYHAPVCMGYVDHGEYRVAALQTMLRMYIAIFLSPYPHHHERSTECIMNALTWLNMRLIKTPSRKKLLQPFLLECYGRQVGLFTMRRKMLERDQKNV